MSCLNIFLWYLEQNRDWNKNLSKKAILQKKEKELQNYKLTINVANVRAVEYISRCFGIKHKDFERDKTVYKSILGLRATAMRILSILYYTPPLLGEIQYWMALDKILFAYTKRGSTKEQVENQVYKFGQNAQEMEKFEPSDYVQDMHYASLNFLFRLAHN